MKDYKVQGYISKELKDKINAMASDRGISESNMVRIMLSSIFKVLESPDNWKIKIDPSIFKDLK